jgi:hypothetical protein
VAGNLRCVTTASPSDVRAWARQQGLTSAERGPIPRSVLAAYATAHAGRPPADAPVAALPEAAGREHELEARLRRVETQLAQALERVEALEARASRSLLGLRVTL